MYDSSVPRLVVRRRRAPSSGLGGWPRSFLIDGRCGALWAMVGHSGDPAGYLEKQQQRRQEAKEEEVEGAEEEVVEEEAALVARRVAAEYMRLSRASSLEQVYGMFSADAAYRSDALGTVCIGLPAIREMMNGFFARYPDVKWEVTSLGLVDRSEPRPEAVKVAVEFNRYSTTETGEYVKRSGREWIYVDPKSARIVFVHVAPLDP
ncbi:hypothetical protein VOLCADRAFT_106361 [Volvox carteri f. nagariensis]|uniref:SnoaL-like domain-containing protein n=1 Tax=Volvox carteri f. nagariensis TaxID=3068 RepID=D8U6W0_VOLCA|nr:uncharacterized protein VOLCADRAFT_106361 [Volvox carteri f. nagariensis]EFJ44506.1 hypothetical protein VOLCADRAFT_106361 [Volvox carteri f. nagariensis]|eukprot:XP_002954356.1 hypothetical protein VOLCADRAFT_106361 [Volvox carteri f. nagariensis]